MKVRHKALSIVVLVAIVMAVLVSMQSLVLTGGSSAPVPAMSIMPIDVAETSAGGVAGAPSLIEKRGGTFQAIIGDFAELNWGVIAGIQLAAIGVGLAVYGLLNIRGVRDYRTTDYHLDTRRDRTSGRKGACCYQVDSRPALAGGDR